MEFRKKTTATILIALFLIPMFAVAIPVFAPPAPLVAQTDTYTLTLSVDVPAGGSVEAVPPGDPVGLYELGASVTLTYTENPGYSFVEWWDVTLDVTLGSGATLIVVMDANKDISAKIRAMIVSIDIDWFGYPAPIDFGPVSLGVATPPEVITVTNDGDYDVTVDMTMSTDTLDFYADSLKINGEYLANWPTFGPMIPTASAPANLILQTTKSYPTGSYPGTLLFTASSVP